MDSLDAIDLGREAIITALLIGSPVLIVGAAVGLLIGLIQALTQIQDQTISFVPKILAMVAALGICLPWLIQKMMEYSEDLIRNIPTVIMGG
jgi:flagellar biosynthetic protein FliQ